jgi:hypothetical protein
MIKYKFYKCSYFEDYNFYIIPYLKINYEYGSGVSFDFGFFFLRILFGIVKTKEEI